MRIILKKTYMQENTRNIIEYLFVCFLIPLVCILLMAISKNQVINFVLYGIEGASPAISVIIIQLIHHGKAGLKKYMYNKYIANFMLKKCLFAIFVPSLLLTCAKVLSIYAGDETNFFTHITAKKIVIISWALIAEELGWRGYLQELLDKTFTHKLIPAFTGVIWALWHYHFMLSGSMGVPFLAFGLSCVFESYGYYTITKMSKNNIIPASIWHFTGNLMFNLYRFDPHWHNGNNIFYWITTGFYVVNILLFVIHEKYFQRSEEYHTP